MENVVNDFDFVCIFTRNLGAFLGMVIKNLEFTLAFYKRCNISSLVKIDFVVNKKRSPAVTTNDGRRNGWIVYKSSEGPRCPEK